MPGGGPIPIFFCCERVRGSKYFGVVIDQGVVGGRGRISLEGEGGLVWRMVFGG